MPEETRETCLVILGAGASNDCIPMNVASTTEVGTEGLPSRMLQHVRPPMTKDLVRPNAFINEILTRWSPARHVMDYLRRNAESDDSNGLQTTLSLEKGLAQYQKKPFPQKELHLLGFAMVLRDLLWACTDYMQSEDLTGGVTNYHTLSRHLMEWTSDSDRCAVLTSFNYDLLLERALEDAWRFDPFKMDSYLEHDQIALLKPHGSVQWGWPVPNVGHTSRADPIIYGNRSIDLAIKNGYDRSSFEPLKWPTHDWSTRPILGPSLVPAIALPMDGKADFTWPREHRARLDELRGSVSRLVVIGWRGLDEHLLSLLRPLVREEAKVLVVSGGAEELEAQVEAREIGDRIQRHIDVDQRRFEYSGKGFSGVVETDVRTFLD